jgi:hypothetical protein
MFAHIPMILTALELNIATTVASKLGAAQFLAIHHVVLACPS